MVLSVQVEMYHTQLEIQAVLWEIFIHKYNQLLTMAVKFVINANLSGVTTRDLSKTGSRCQVADIQ